MRFEDVDASAPGEGMVRIAVRASAINYFDALMVAGQYQVKPDLPFVPGNEISGVVEHAPRDSGFNGGDRVSALLDNGGLTRGGYAEIADAHADTAAESQVGARHGDAAAGKAQLGQAVQVSWAATLALMTEPAS